MPPAAVWRLVLGCGLTAAVAWPTAVLGPASPITWLCVVAAVAAAVRTASMVGRAGGSPSLAGALALVAAWATGLAPAIASAGFEPVWAEKAAGVSPAQLADAARHAALRVHISEMVAWGAAMLGGGVLGATVAARARLPIRALPIPGAVLLITLPGSFALVSAPMLNTLHGESTAGASRVTLELLLACEGPIAAAIAGRAWRAADHYERLLTATLLATVTVGLAFVGTLPWVTSLAIAAAAIAGWFTPGSAAPLRSATDGVLLGVVGGALLAPALVPIVALYTAVVPVYRGEPSTFAAAVAPAFVALVSTTLLVVLAAALGRWRGGLVSELEG